MMKPLFSNVKALVALLCLITLGSFKVAGSPIHNDANLSKKKDGIVRILAIGNSFSVDAVENYLYDLAKAANKRIIIGSVAISGGNLDQHLSNARTNDSVYIYTKIDVDGKKTTTFNNAIKPVLTSERWDYISFQQVSQHSGMYETFVTPMPAFLEYVKQNVTNDKVKYVLHQTWAYAQNSTHSGFSNYDNNQLKMYQAIADTYKKVSKLTNIDMIIPVGTAIQNGRTSFIGDNFTRDGFHLEESYARYTAACTWFEKIFRKSVLGNRFKPAGITDAQRDVAQRAASLAVKYPDKVTQVKELITHNTFKRIVNYKTLAQL